MWFLFTPDIRPVNYDAREVETVDYEDLSDTITEDERIQEIYF